MKLPQVASAEELLSLVETLGFLPFFKNGIEGFSIEECCPSHLWFAADAEGPWEWKGPVAKTKRCIYGKFFGGKAGFVSLDQLPNFINYRRDGYDFDAKYEDGLAFYKDKELYDTVAENGVLLSKRLKELCNYRKGGNKGFDTVITRLQMQGYLCIADFVYLQDRFGKPYGWGVAEYTTPEALFGYDAVTAAYEKDPQESWQEMLRHLTRILPDATEEQIQKLMK